MSIPKNMLARSSCKCTHHLSSFHKPTDGGLWRRHRRLCVVNVLYFLVCCQCIVLSYIQQHQSCTSTALTLLRSSKCQYAEMPNNLRNTVSPICCVRPVSYCAMCVNSRGAPASTNMRLTAFVVARHPMVIAACSMQCGTCGEGR